MTMNTITNTISQVFRGVHPRSPPAQRPPTPPLQLSKFSTPGVSNSGWASEDFMLGAGMVIIQRNTHKIVVIYEARKRYWFFPRGRKDVGESLEQTALREAYEESGYRARFMPILNPTRQPSAPHERETRNALNVEPIFMSVISWKPKIGRNGELYDTAGEYLITWYVGEIPEDAVHEPGTGMPDEQNFQSYLLTYEQAMGCVLDSERKVLQYAWEVYVLTLGTLNEANQLNQQAEQPEHGPAS